MPIDFQPHFYHAPVVFQQLVSANNNYKIYQQPKMDIFIKNTDFNYDGIKIEQRPFGKIKKTKEQAILYTITNKNGASVNLSTFGATITGIKVPDKNGKLVDVTQGYTTVTPYEKYPVGHAGGTIGPYANKISDGKFILNNKEYFLECNKDNGKTHSHGGTQGFDVQNWNAKVLKDGIEFSYLKKDMENGYPGNVQVFVVYKFDNNNNLHIKYKATTDKDTIINLTNHTYFNLDGAENTFENSVLDHIVQLPNSQKITENNLMAIPTGKFLNVENTPFDFSSPKRIKDVINSDNEQIKIGSGFDQNYCVDNYNGTTNTEVANIESEKTGIILKVSTNLPGFQFYTANHLGKPTQPNGKNGQKYEKRSALCIEPQYFPNSINTETFKEKGILKAGDEFNKEIIYSFKVKKN